MDKALHGEHVKNLLHSVRYESPRPIVYGANGLNQVSCGAFSGEEAIFQEVLRRQEIESRSSVIVEKKSKSFTTNLDPIGQSIY